MLFAAASAMPLPSFVWLAPFAAILLCIALFPLLHSTRHWWEKNVNKLLLGLALGGVVAAHYGTRGFGVGVHEPQLARLIAEKVGPVQEHEGHFTAEPGRAAVAAVIGNALLEYIPFIVLLFSLYCVAGGILLRGDLPARPATNTAILAAGGLLASLIGTTGASMLLIRPLLKTNSERKHVVHTVVFFIFIVSNIGGSLLPIGDPPLFLGYLRGVPFLWTLSLWKAWALMLAVLLLLYFVYDSIVYRREPLFNVARDETQVVPLRVEGLVNLYWLIGIVLTVALLDPSKPLPGTQWKPPLFLREGIQLAFVMLSFATTPRGLRRDAQFNFHAIAEVACLFIGIFITMQVPIEILHARGAALGLSQPWQFFWATGMLSSFLDNAPTYVVFFETANSMTHSAGPGVLTLLDGNFIRADLLLAVSLGAVFMGANTYIGNGPNFMVKAIAEQAGVKMPSFFGFMLYSGLILVPLFVVLTYAML